MSSTETWVFPRVRLDIAETMYRAGAFKESAALLQRAFDSFPDRTTASGRVLFFLEAARGEAKVGDTAGARDAIQRMKQALLGISEDLRTFHLGEAAAVQIQIGDIEGAAETLHELPPMNSITIDRLGEMAAIRIRAGDLAGALQYADAPVPGLSPEETDTRRSLLLARIMSAQIEAGDLNGAQTTASGIPSIMFRASAWAELSTAQFLAGDRRSASDLLGRASKLGNGMEVVHSDIATAQAKSGDFASALQTVESLAKQAYSAKPKLLTELSEVAAAAHHIDVSEKMLSEAFTLATSDKDPEWQRAAVQELVATQARVGLFAAALKTASTLPESDRHFVLWKIGLEQAKSGDMRESERTVAGLDSLTFAIPELAVAKARQGDFTYAFQLNDVHGEPVIQTLFSEKVKLGELAEAVSWATPFSASLRDFLTRLQMQRTRISPLK
ncbi:MAG: hypothetical protein JWO91_3396 [Acidobacteriaceae bacterium]|nr:hypothetical protein [Acidobacteriaceae bacterium]